MSWALIDDQSTFHAKVVAAGNSGWGACVRMIAWSMSHLTDGRIPTHVAKLIASEEDLVALERAGLIAVRPDEVEIHDFLQWNKSAKQIRKERSARAKAGKNGGLASGRRRQQTPSKREANASANAQALATGFGSTFPNPSSSPLLSSSEEEKEERETVPADAGRPAPPKAKPSAKTKSTALPEDWAPPPGFWDWAAKKRYARSDVERCAEAMTLWARGSGARKADWTATLQGWVNREASEGKVATVEAPRPSRGLRDVPTAEELASVDHAAVAANIRAARERLRAQLVTPPDDTPRLFADDASEVAS